MRVIQLENIGSTNEYLLNGNKYDDLCVVADYQSAGKGMGSNTWESEAGKNLLFSILIHPVWLPITEQYLVSMAEAVAIVDSLSPVLPNLTIKWPNDIYWENKKLSGTRIDVNIQGGGLRDMVIGTGINVNQEEFKDTAPNPVSLKQITGKDHSREEILQVILERFEEYLEMLRMDEKERIVKKYHERLYRREGWHQYEDSKGTFEAELVKVAKNGIMTLRRKDGTLSEYEFKEVKFLIEH